MEFNCFGGNLSPIAPLIVPEFEAVLAFYDSRVLIFNLKSANLINYLSFSEADI
jgi:hypothetical protein